MGSLGYCLEEDITLRRRLSRNGFALRQSLLVFRARQKIRSYKEDSDKVFWRPKWSEFKENLPHQKGDFAKRNWGHPLHSLCSYQGKMKPSIAHHLINTFVPKGGRVLDPFSGVGTIPFAGALEGLETFAFEISPLALLVSQGKLKRHDSEACERLITRLEEFIRENRSVAYEFEAAKRIRFNGDLMDYFSPRTFNEILLARRFFLNKPIENANESLVFSSLVHILHGNRPYALSRRSHPITPYAPTGEFEYRSLIERLREKVRRSLEAELPITFTEGSVLHQDATLWWNNEVEELDAVITSPPFFDSTRYYLANWMRLWFCGWEAEDFKIKPLAFVDEKQKVSFEAYEPIFRQSRERLKTGGVMVLHLGKSKKCDMADELSRIGKNWFRVADVFSESVDHCESHGLRDKGTVTSHQYLVLY